MVVVFFGHYYSTIRNPIIAKNMRIKRKTAVYYFYGVLYRFVKTANAMTATNTNTHRPNIM
jgi:hypothetical protein